jgi:hypothetical protein
MPSVHDGLVPNRGLIDCSGQSVHGDVLRTSQLARIIHERFCCNRAFAATTSLSPGVLAAQVRPPHRLGGAHKRGALYSSRRAPLDILFQVCLRPSRLRLGVPIAGTPAAPFFMQRVEHAYGSNAWRLPGTRCASTATGGTRRTVMNNAGWLTAKPSPVLVSPATRARVTGSGAPVKRDQLSAC